MFEYLVWAAVENDNLENTDEDEEVNDWEED